MKKLFSNIRFYTLASAVILSLLIYLLFSLTIPPESIRIVKLVEWYGFISIAFLYITLLAGPLCFTFRSLPFRGYYLHARRSLGVASFYFAFLHSFISLFWQLGGFNGLGFLSNNYLFAIAVGFIALIILSLLAITSFDYIVAKLSFPKWKLLHRFVYLAGILILVHIVMLGSHYSDLTGTFSVLTFFALAFLLFLEAPRFDKLIKRFVSLPAFGFTFVIFIFLFTAVFFTIIHPVLNTSSGGLSFDIHAIHKQLAQQALQTSKVNYSLTNLNNIPGLNGDRTRRYTASIIAPNNVLPNQDINLGFRIYDASSGTPITSFLKLYQYPLHFIKVDSTLSYFGHIHPDEQPDGEFTITTQFPQKGLYHLYIQFQPLGGIEQQMAFILPVGIGPNDSIPFSNQPVDKKLTKTFADYEVTLDTHGSLTARNMTLGNDKLSFTIKDAKTKRPITTLKPFMGAFGHLSMINEKTYDFIHVHPFTLTPPPPDANGGPTVDFLPIGIYGPFKPGIYRVFGEFSTQIGTDFDTDFTVDVK